MDFSFMLYAWILLMLSPQLLLAISPHLFDGRAYTNETSLEKSRSSFTTSTISISSFSPDAYSSPLLQIKISSSTSSSIDHSTSRPLPAIEILTSSLYSTDESSTTTKSYSSSLFSAGTPSPIPPKETSTTDGNGRQSSSGEHVSSSSVATSTPSVFKNSSKMSTVRSTSHTITSMSKSERMVYGENRVCTHHSTDPDTRTHCRISIGTVQLHYWPTGSVTKNHTFPSIRVIPELGLTMHSPSIYYVVNTMVAVDWCNTPHPEKWGNVKNYVTSYPIESVTTLAPFGNNYGPGHKTRNNTRIGPDRQLYLNDLGTDCPKKTKIPWRNRIQEKYHDPRCDPILQFRKDLIEIKGHPEVPWPEKCSVRWWGGRFGVFDPPVPILPCTASDCANQGADIASPPPPAEPRITLSPSSDENEEGSNNSVPTPEPGQSAPSPGPTATSINNVPVPTSDSSDSDSTDPDAHQNDPVANNQQNDPQNYPQNSDYQSNDSSENLSSTIAAPLPGTQTSDDPPPESSTTLIPLPVTVLVPIATFQNGVVVNILSGASSVAVGSQIISLHGPSVTVDNHGIMSFASEGLIVVDHESSSTYPFPVATPVVPPVNTAVYSGQPLTLGSPSVTIPNKGAVSQSPSGILFVDNDITFTRPLSQLESTPTNLLSTLATVFNGQTLTLNGPATFIPGVGTLSLSPSGVIIVNNGVTITSTLAGSAPSPIPTPTPTILPLPPITITIADQTHILSGLSPSVYIIDDQTLTLSGPLATVIGTQVVGLKDKGMVVQVPGGGVTTISIKPATVRGDLSVGTTGTGLILSEVIVTSSTRAGGGVFVGSNSTATSAGASSMGLGEVIWNMQASGGFVSCCYLWSKVLISLLVGLGNLLVS